MRLSYSAIKMFNECPFKFYNNYLAKEEEGLLVEHVPVDEFFAFIGKSMQSILERTTNNRLYKLSSITELVDLLLDEIPKFVRSRVYDMNEDLQVPVVPEEKYVFFHDSIYSGINMEKHDVDDIILELKRFANTVFVDYLVNPNIVFGGDIDNCVCEHMFSYDNIIYNGIKFKFIGYLDWIVKDPSGHYNIVDGKRNVSRFTSREQLIVYKSFMEKIYDIKIGSISFWDYTKNKIMIQNDEGYDTIMEEINRTIEKISSLIKYNGLFEKKPGNGCVFCSVGCFSKEKDEYNKDGDLLL